MATMLLTPIQTLLSVVVGQPANLPTNNNAQLSHCDAILDPG